MLSRKKAQRNIPSINVYEVLQQAKIAMLIGINLLGMQIK